MKKIKMIYFGLFLIGIFLVSSTYFSYAFFTSKNEVHGKLNIVVGTLEYKIESSDLQDNSIIVSSGDTKIITLSVKSLNDVASKYELYYKLENDNALVTVGFLEDSLNTKSGILEKSESKEVEVIIRNKSDSSQKIIFGVEGGLLNNDLVLNNNKSSLVDYCSKEDIYTFDYTGSEQKFVTPCSGGYQLETWGAQGGVYHGGYGGYSSGVIELGYTNILHINVGGTDQRICENYSEESTGGSCLGGYNGGGKSTYSTNGKWGAGGGATHISTQSGLLSTLSNDIGNILIVSGGGGGQYGDKGGNAGGYKGNDGGTREGFIQAIGGSQLEGGSGKVLGEFGQGANATAGNVTGGGGGFYGGGGALGISAAGGSGYIGNSLLTNKVMYCYECEESSEESTKTVSTTNVSEEPISNFAKIGNGYAKITYLGK